MYVTGRFSGGVDFGDGTLTSNGFSDMYVASFTSGGAYRLARAHGGSSGDQGTSVVADGSGNVFVLGVFTNIADFGGGDVTSNGSSDMFLLKLAP